MKSNRMIKTVECSHPRWPFQRHSTAWLPTFTLCLLSCLLPASAQMFTRVTNELQYAQADAGGIVWFDYDNDGWADVLLAGGYSGSSSNRLFHNNRDGTFTQLGQTNFAGYGVRAYWATVADFNDDGYLDIVALNFPDPASGLVEGNPYVYLNQRSGSFTKLLLDRSAILGGTDARASTVTALDYNRDGFVDLALGRYDIPARSYLLKNTGGRHIFGDHKHGLDSPGRAVRVDIERRL